jgi:hypothetical protein
MKLQSMVFLGVSLLTMCFSTPLFAYSQATCGAQKYVCCNNQKAGSSSAWQTTQCGAGSVNTNNCSAMAGLNCTYS